MRELAKITAKLKDGKYDGVMIIKARWERIECNDSYEPDIVKETKRMLVCQACYHNQRLSTTMLLNPAMDNTLPAGDFPKEAMNSCWHTFTRQEVLDFVEAVGDTNPIHRTEQPVVPGLLLLETIKAGLPENLDVLELSFRNAVFSGDPLELVVEGNQLEVKGRCVFVTGWCKYV